MQRLFGLVLIVFWMVANADARPLAEQAGHPKTVCDLVAEAAHRYRLPARFLARLIWQESSFRADAVSPKGAQGIAQFMPATAARRGLADPFDPNQSIPVAAHLIMDLRARFGNLGLAAAAYNAGADRVDDWLSKERALPAETQAYVIAVTGFSVERWSAVDFPSKDPPLLPSTSADCASIAAGMTVSADLPPSQQAQWQPWGVQLVGGFSQGMALDQFRQLQRRYPAILGGLQPLVLRKQNLSRGRKPLVEVRLAAPTRAKAMDLCQQLRAKGGACVVLKN